MNCFIALTVPDVELSFTDYIYHDRNNASTRQREKYLTHTMFGGLLILMVTWGLPCMSECWGRQGEATGVRRQEHGVITVTLR